MYEIKLNENDDFLKIKETLQRIGVVNFKSKTLYQSCHILQKGGRYYICHFKQLFELDGRKSLLSYEDQDRLRDITQLLINWGLCKPVTSFKATGANNFKVLSFEEKDEWNLVAKYSLGKRA